MSVALLSEFIRWGREEAEQELLRRGGGQAGLAPVAPPPVPVIGDEAAAADEK